MEQEDYLNQLPLDHISKILQKSEQTEKELRKELDFFL